jgi:hypothetical protein
MSFGIVKISSKQCERKIKEYIEIHPEKGVRVKGTKPLGALPAVLWSGFPCLRSEAGQGISRL